MTFFVDSVIQVSMILLLALFSMALLRKSSSAMRHWVLSAAIFCAAIVPALQFLVPSWSLTPIVTKRVVAIVSPSNVAAIDFNRSVASADSVAPPKISALSRTFPVRTETIRWMPAALWLTGLSVGLVSLMVGLLRLARVASLSRPIPNAQWDRLAKTISRNYGIRRLVQLLQSQNRSILVTWGLIQPQVILPAGSADWTEERARIVLLHEFAHVRRRDWIVQMLGQLLRIVYWFNPLVWMVCNRLRLESERACDDAVLSSDVSSHEYASHLVDLARVLNNPGRSWSAAVAMAHSSSIERRFSAMLNPALNRRPVSQFAMLAIIFLGLCVTAPVVTLTTAAPPLHQAVLVPVAAVETAELPVAIEPEAPVAAPVVPPELPKPQPKTEPVLESAQVPNVDELKLKALQADLTNARALNDKLRVFIAKSVSTQRANVSAIDRALYEAAESGHLSEVNDLIRSGANVNVAIPGDGSPLIGAARGGHLAVVRALLDLGADPNMPVVGDGNPLIRAAASGHADVVTLLLDRGANIHQIVRGDENALISASAFGKLDIVKLLVSRGADVNVRVEYDPSPWYPNGETRTALSMARRGGHQAVVDFLISVGARD